MVTERVWLLVALSLVSSGVGCGDDLELEAESPSPEPAINAVIPAEGFSGRTIRVQVSGDDTELTAAVALDFGAGITVSDIDRASPSDVFATITIAPDAAPGRHDVTIKDGDIELTLAGAFEVESPIELVLQGGDPQQGGFAFLAVVNRDVANPFPLDASRIQITGASGTNLFVAQNDSYTALVTALFDTDAASGEIELAYDFGSTHVTSRGGMVAVAHRSAIPVTVDATQSGTLTTGSALYALSRTAPALVFGTVATSDPSALPTLVFLPGGKWANARFQSFGGALDRLPVVSQETYAVVVDSQAQGYAFELALDTYADLTGVQPITATDSTPVGLFHGDVSDLTEDWIKVSATAGQTIRVITTGGGKSGTTDTEVAIYDTDGTTPIAGGSPFTDSYGPEDVTSLPVTATGDYFVVVRQSSDFFACYFNSCDRYEAAILVQDSAPFLQAP